MCVCVRTRRIIESRRSALIGPCPLTETNRLGLFTLDAAPHAEMHLSQEHISGRVKQLETSAVRTNYFLIWFSEDLISHSVHGLIH